MKVSAWKSTVTGLIGFALVLSACGGATGSTNSNDVSQEAKVNQAFTVTGDVTVTISTYNGDIKVTTGSVDQVQVEVVKHGGGTTDAEAKADLDNIQLSLSQTSGNVKLVATHAGRVPTNSKASFVVVMPPDSKVVATLDNGSITVDGVKGGVYATSTNGELNITGAGKADLTAKTVNGNVTLTGQEVTKLTASSSNGNVSFIGSLAESKAANRIDVGNGNATFGAPGDTQFGIDALTSNGALTSDFVFQGDSTKSSVKGTIGSSPTFSVVVRVKNGSITLRKS
jgi:DUF4097 and DUF4098 domain-containing protein YvlB